MRIIMLVSFLGATLCAQEAARYDSLKVKAKATLEAGKPSEALAMSVEMAKKSADDYDLQYIVAKAYRLLGQLPQAEKATQWLLDLRPDNLGGLHEAGLLRECFNDLDGAVDLLNRVFRATPVSKHKERAELLTDIARVFDKQGNKQGSGQLRAEVERLKGLEIANEKATTTATHQ